MSGVFFRPETMIASMTALVRPDVIGKFLAPSARKALEDASSKLNTRWTDPHATDFYWSGQIRTNESTFYKGSKDRKLRPIFATVDFEWKCSKSDKLGKRCPEGYAWLKEGVVNVKFFRPDDTSLPLKSFHHDHDAKPDLKNHPFSHLQTNPDTSGSGPLNDIPRWPAILMTPVDVIENVIWDLWPEAWLKTIGGTIVASHLKLHHEAQTTRIQAVCEAFKQNACGGPYPNRTALHGIRSPLSSPLQLA